MACNQEKARPCLDSLQGTALALHVHINDGYNEISAMPSSGKAQTFGFSSAQAQTTSRAETAGGTGRCPGNSELHWSYLHLGWPIMLLLVLVLLAEFSA